LTTSVNESALSGANESRNYRFFEGLGGKNRRKVTPGLESRTTNRMQAGAVFFLQSVSGGFSIKTGLSPRPVARFVV